VSTPFQKVCAVALITIKLFYVYMSLGSFTLSNNSNFFFCSRLFYVRRRIFYINNLVSFSTAKVEIEISETVFTVFSAFSAG